MMCRGPAPPEVSEEEEEEEEKKRYRNQCTLGRPQ
jgi:hypothetical protein